MLVSFPHLKGRKGEEREGCRERGREGGREGGEREGGKEGGRRERERGRGWWSLNSPDTQTSGFNSRQSENTIPIIKDVL